MEKHPILAIALIVPILGLFGGKIDLKKRTCSVAEVQRRGNPSHSATAKSSA